MSRTAKRQSAHRPHPAGKPEAAYPIYAKSRTSSDIMKHAAKAFKHLDEGPRGGPHYAISPPHQHQHHQPSSSIVTPSPRLRSRTPANQSNGNGGGGSIVEQLLTLSQMKKENTLTDREFALAKWQILGLTHKQEDGAKTHGGVHIANTFSPTSASRQRKQLADAPSSSSRRRQRPRSGGRGRGGGGEEKLAPKQAISRIQQRHADAVRSSPRPLYAHHYNKVYVCARAGNVYF